MKLLVLASLILFPVCGILYAIENNRQQDKISEIENNQHLQEAVQIFTQTFPLRHKLFCINNSIAALNGKVKEEQKKAFKIHHEDVKKALDKVSNLCQRVNTSLCAKEKPDLQINEKPENMPQLLQEAQTTLKQAQKELGHYERSFDNHVKEINAKS